MESTIAVSFCLERDFLEVSMFIKPAQADELGFVANLIAKYVPQGHFSGMHQGAAGRQNLLSSFARICGNGKLSRATCRGIETVSTASRHLVVRSKRKCRGVSHYRGHRQQGWSGAGTLHGRGSAGISGARHRQVFDGFLLRPFRGTHAPRPMLSGFATNAANVSAARVQPIWQNQRRQFPLPPQSPRVK